MAGSELKPVRCGCGGATRRCADPITGQWFVQCRACGTVALYYDTEAEAITAWNRAMSGSAEEKLKAFWDGMSAEMKEERTAKVKKSWGFAMCCACEKRVFPCDNYCSHCGARLEWK